MKFLQSQSSYSSFFNETTYTNSSSNSAKVSGNSIYNSMVLRSKKLIKKYHLVQGISQLISHKHRHYKDVFSVSNGNVSKKKSKPAKRRISKELCENPYLSYRKNLTQTPNTPSNPFCKTPVRFQRRSKRLSNINGDQISASTKVSSFDSAVKKLVANSNELDKAIHHDNIANKRASRSQTPLKSNKATSGLKRRLSVRFRKYSALETSSHIATRSSKRLCGKYNQAHYFEG